MQVHRETPKDHDSIVSSISHLPHLIASSLADHLASCPASWLEMAGQGFKDTTRIAQGDPTLWCEIMKSNRKNLCDSLDKWQKSVDEVRSLLHAEKWDNLTQYLSDAADHRKKIKSEEWKV
jgi:prephenate dehydrogenase